MDTIFIELTINLISNSYTYALFYRMVAQRSLDFGSPNNQIASFYFNNQVTEIRS